MHARCRPPHFKLKTPCCFKTSEATPCVCTCSGTLRELPKAALRRADALMLHNVDLLGANGAATSSFMFTCTHDVLLPAGWRQRPLLRSISSTLRWLAGWLAGGSAQALQLR